MEYGEVICFFLKNFFRNWTHYRRWVKTILINMHISYKRQRIPSDINTLWLSKYISNASDTDVLRID